MSSWGDLIAIVFGASVVSSAWNTFWNWRFARGDRTKNSRFIALQASIALERYAIACWPVTYSGKDHFQHTHEPFFVAMPELSGLPASEYWSALDPALADAALAFANKIEISAVKSAHAGRFEGNPFDIETEAARRGQEAWDIAERLRVKYELPAQATTKAAISTLWDKDVDW